MHPRLALIADGHLPPERSSPQDDTAAQHTAPPGEPAWWADHTRVAGGDGAPAPVARPGLPARSPLPASPGRAEPPALPVPGRHAARRRLRLVPRGLPERLPSLGPAHVAIVAIAVAVALAVTTWWVARDQPVPAADSSPALGESVAPLLAGTTPAGASSGAPEAAGAPATVTVDVAGRVRRPGIVVLDAGARVTDALSAAGGPRRGVDLTSLNLARVLVDGEQIVVGAPAGAAPGAGGGSGSGGGGPGSAGPLVNLNLATQAELESLPQVGPVTAQSIIDWREERGGFTSVDELLEVDGIGEKTLERLAPHVTV